MREREQTGYVYSMWSGRLLIKEATIKNYPSESRNAELAFAKFSDGKCIEVNQSPGDMHNAIVWFNERVDEIAIGILIDYEMAKIEQLQEKIGNHKHRIKILNASLSGAL